MRAYSWPPEPVATIVRAVPFVVTLLGHSPYAMQRALSRPECCHLARVNPLQATSLLNSQAFERYRRCLPLGACCLSGTARWNVTALLPCCQTERPGPLPYRELTEDLELWTGVAVTPKRRPCPTETQVLPVEPWPGVTHRAAWWNVSALLPCLSTPPVRRPSRGSGSGPTPCTCLGAGCRCC